MDKRVVEGCKDVSNSKNGLSFAYLRSQSNDGFLFLNFSFTGCHDSKKVDSACKRKNTKMNIHTPTPLGKQYKGDRTR
jgi:hypothetical protein